MKPAPVCRKALDAVTGLARLEMRLNPERAYGWLALVADHPAATQDMKDRAAQLCAQLYAALGTRPAKPALTLEMVLEEIAIS